MKKNGVILDSGTCKSCRKKVIWGVTQEGRRLPLDPKQPVYRIVISQGIQISVEKDKEAMIDHSRTCTEVNSRYQFKLMQAVIVAAEDFWRAPSHQNNEALKISLERLRRHKERTEG